jgi:hypothetical protein
MPKNVEEKKRIIVGKLEYCKKDAAWDDPFLFHYFALDSLGVSCHVVMPREDGYRMGHSWSFMSRCLTEDSMIDIQ